MNLSTLIPYGSTVNKSFSCYVKPLTAVYVDLKIRDSVMEIVNVSEIPLFTKEETLNLRFPCKLWILINTPNRVVTWGRNGTTILLDYIALDFYLSSALSIFRTKNCFNFLRQLDLYGFRKVVLNENAEIPGNGVFFEFENANFVQSRDDLIANVAIDSSRQKQLPKLLQHVRPLRAQDPCSSVIRALSAIEKARLNLRVVLKMQSENYTLSKKLSDCAQKSPSSGVSVIELPADAFENPFDSISQFEENLDYAGYYGNASTDQIKQFFDEYLPVYAQANGDEVADKPDSFHTTQKETPKQSASTSFSYFVPGERSEESAKEDLDANPSNYQIKYSVNLAETDNKDYTLDILEETCSRFGASDGAVGMFNEGEDGADNSGREEDISMDQYLKFRDSPQRSEEKNDSCPVNICDIKHEAAEQNVSLCGPGLDAESGDCDDVADNNFKNFFNQYRESINLLYD